MFFKRLPVVDVLILTGLHAWRLIIGGAIAGITVSPWLLVFSYCLFVALALVKRLDELAALDVGQSGRPGRSRLSQKPPPRRKR